MKTNRLYLSLAFAACLLPAMADAATQYVRQGAAGRGDGSDWANAYTTLPANLVRGDTYYVADGSYGRRSFSTPNSGSTAITIKKATAADHGTSTGWQASYGDGQAVFTSWDFSTGYWILDGQTGGGAADRWDRTTFGFKLTAGSGAMANVAGSANSVTMRHVEFVGGGSGGNMQSNDGLVNRGSNVTLSYFKMNEIGKSPFWIGAVNTVIEHGWIGTYYSSAEAHSEVASIWNIGPAFGNATFRYNLFTHITGTGGIIWDSSSNSSARLYVYGNVFYRPSGARWDRANGVIGGWTGGNGEKFQNVTVYNNTFINVDQESLSTLPNIYSGNVAYDNVFYNSNSPSFSRFGSHDRNHFINSGGTAGEPNGTSSASGDPFVDYVNLDFRLKAGTPKGSGFSAPFNVDPLGQVRGADGSADRGAFEFGSTSTIAPPSNLQAY